jgi:hypothetical protein
MLTSSGNWSDPSPGSGVSRAKNDRTSCDGAVTVDDIASICLDTVGLGAHRSRPEYLARYVALCDELGV